MVYVCIPLETPDIVEGINIVLGIHAECIPLGKALRELNTRNTESIIYPDISGERVSRLAFESLLDRRLCGAHVKTF